MNVHLNRLRYFVTVADELHFGRAAERLHMAQPPLSQAIQQLEAELDVRLFERTTRRVSLTDAGILLRPMAVRVLAAVDEATEKMRSYKLGHSGVLRLGFVDSASYDVMPRFLSHYAAEYPEVDYELRTLSSDEQHRALVDRDIDLGIARARRAGSSIAATPVVEEPLVAAVSDSNALAARKTMSLGQLAGQRLIGFDRAVSPSLFSELAQLFAAADVDYDPIIEATEYATVLGLVASGQGVAVVPASVQSFRPPGLTYLRVRDAGAKSALMLLNREEESSLLVAHAIQVVSTLFGVSRPS